MDQFSIYVFPEFNVMEDNMPDGSVHVAATGSWLMKF